MTTEANTISSLRPAERFKFRLATAVWVLLVAGFLLAIPILTDITWLLPVALIVVALLLAFPGAWLVRVVFRGQREQSFGSSLFKASLGILFVLSILVAAPIYVAALLPALRPLIVPQATLSNGTKTVVFQGMVHVGSEGFYKSVVYDIEKALVDGYDIYYEGIMPDPAGDKWFSDRMASGGDLSTNYETLGEVCGLQFQLNYFTLLLPDMAARPDRHVTADVSTADMMNEYDRLLKEDPVFAAAEAARPPEAEQSEPGGGFGGILDWMNKGTPEQRKLAGYACRGFLTYSLAQAAQPEQIDKVVLDFRNRSLADRVTTATNPLIYMTYGAGHLPGLLADLQARDPAWEVKSVKWMRTLAAPEELEGNL